MRTHACPRGPSTPWTGILQLVALAMIAQLAPPLDALAATLNQTGRWTSTGNLGFSGVHVAVLRKPGTDSTTVFFFGESGKPQQMRYWRFRALNPLTPFPDTSQLFHIPHPNDLENDLFCNGHASLPDGRLALIGGSWLPPAPCRQAYAFDPGWVRGSPSGPWTKLASMANERWYPTISALSSGELLAASGNMNSRVIGFGGLAVGATMDTTWRVLQPLEASGRYVWGDTTAIPLKAENFCGTSNYDNFTEGRFPPGRDEHAFVGDPAGRGILYGGRRKKPDASFEFLNDIWLLEGSPCNDDTTHSWRLMEQVADPVAGLPPKRRRFAATWAGVEGRGESFLPDAFDAIICYIHGGLDEGGAPLGDLWRGERQTHGAHYDWKWTRILDNTDETRKRYGHTMVFDPGPPVLPAPDSGSAPYGRLLIYGGRRSDGSLADPAHLYAYGVGSSVSGIWSDLTLAGLVPPARESHAMVPRWRGSKGKRRDFYVFGGEDATGVPVSPDLWRLTRPDTLIANLDAYSWLKFPAAGGTQSPTGRSQPAAAFAEEGGLLMLAGGDENGSAAANGLSNQIWTQEVDSFFVTGQTARWTQPTMRTFPQHPGPPAIKGMKFINVGPGRNRVSRSLERFTSNGTSGPGDGCGETLVGQWQAASDQHPDSEMPLALYPYMFQLPDGRMFNAGPPPWESPANAYRRFYDLTTKRWNDTPTAGNTDSIVFGSAVMYRPGQILRAGSHGEGPGYSGSSRTETISIPSGQSPTWAYYDTLQIGRPKLLERTNHNLTVLPTGDVLASGGVGKSGKLDQPERNPQIWRTSVGAWNNTDPIGTQWLALDPHIRNYHSTAILLPDARVLTAGGESPNPNQTTASVFEPPYLFRNTDQPATRPQTLLAPGFITFGRVFTLTLTTPTQLGTIRSVALVRPGAVTHGFDQNQRYVPLTFTVATSPTRLLIQAPADASTTPPGDYMLFVVDSLGTDAPAVPSVAWWTRAGTFTPQPDPADVTVPGKVTDLTGCPHADQASGELSWTEPADDWGLTASGRAVSYDLRYKVGTTSPDTSDWATGWVPASYSPSPVPGTPGNLLTIQVTGLAAETKHYFRLRTTDDNGNVSALSNAALIWTKAGLECAGGSSGGGGGGGGSSAERVAGANAARGTVGGAGFENSLLDVAAAGVATSDALRIPAGSGAGPIRLWFRTHGDHATALDHARLRVVEHPAGLEAHVASGSAVVGARTPIAGARLGDGQAFGPSLDNGDCGRLRAMPGDALEVDLGPTPVSALLVEGRSLGGRGRPDAMGFEVQVRDVGGAWSPVARACLRREQDAVAVRGTTGTSVRLVFSGGAEITAISGIAPSPDPILESTIAPSWAWNGFAGDVTPQVAVLDSSMAWLVERDTLQLAFSLPEASTAMVRDVFFELAGATVAPDLAQLNRARQVRSDASPTGERFALHQNRPNPGGDGTVIVFGLPVASQVRLEIFDSQGRRVWASSGRYPAGEHAIAWDLRTNRGRRVGPGLYVYRLSAGLHRAQKKLVVLP